MAARAAPVKPARTRTTILKLQRGRNPVPIEYPSLWLARNHRFPAAHLRRSSAPQRKFCPCSSDRHLAHFPTRGAREFLSGVGTRIVYQTWLKKPPLPKIALPGEQINGHPDLKRQTVLDRRTNPARSGEKAYGQGGRNLVVHGA